MKKTLSFFALLSLATIGQAQENAKANINKLCGCFDVQFKYAETFSPDKNYKFHDREVLSGTELALPIEVSDKKYVIQHILIMDDSIIIKHWREDWVYESPEVLVFQGNKQWIKQAVSPAEYKGKWAQTVWEVDDSPRYQGIGEWVNANGKTYWENTTDAPLPRREYTVRNDYNILKRGNRLVVSDNKWIHEQDNQKIRRTAGKDTLVAEEKGINAYTRVPDARCEQGKAWWAKNGAFWNAVRAEWEIYLKSTASVDLKSKFQDKGMYQYLDVLFTQWYNKKITTPEVSAKVKVIIGNFAAGPAAGTASK